MISKSSIKDIYIFIGPPGSGKGSLANVCSERFGWDVLSTGNLCRKHIVEQTEIGKEIDFAIKSGTLISDELICRMVEHWFLGKIENNNSIILDGYPRTLEQAKIFNNLLKNSDKQLKLHVIEFVISDKVVIERLFFRLTCSNKECQAVYCVSEGSLRAPQKKDICDRCGSTLVRRVDDEITAIQKRLEVYHKHAQSFLNYYENNGYPIVRLDAEKSLEVVFKDFIQSTGVVQI